MEEEDGLGPGNAEAGDATQLERREHSPPAAKSAKSKGSFDYRSLSSNVAGELRALATQIRTRTAEAVIDTGRDLIRVKDQLDHGQFTEWVKRECDIHIRTAENMMAATRFTDQHPKTFSLLPLSVMYLLGNAKNEVKVDKVVAAFEGGKSPSVRKVKEMLGITAPPKPREKRPPRPKKSAARDEAVVELSATFRRLPPEDRLNTVLKLLSDDAGDLSKVSERQRREFVRKIAEKLGVGQQ